MSQVLRNDSSNQVITVIGSIAESLLSNPDIVKCIEDEEGHCFSNCVDQILQNLDIQHPVGSLLQTTLRAHHATYGSCNKTLISMIHYWNRSAQTLLDQGIPAEDITRYFQEGVQLCIDELDSIAIPIETAPSGVSHQYHHRKQDGAECHKSVSSHTENVHNSTSEGSVFGGKKEGCSSLTKELALTACLDGLDIEEPLPMVDRDAGDFSRSSPDPCGLCPTESQSSGDMTSVELQNIGDQDAGVGVNDEEDVSWYFDSAAEADGTIIDDDFYAAMENIARVFNTIGGGLNGSRATMEAMFPIPRAPVRGQGQNGVQVGQGQSAVQVGGQGHSAIQIGGQGQSGAQGRSSPQIDGVLQSQSLNSEMKGQGHCDIGQGRNEVKGQTGNKINFSECTGGDNDAANDDMSWYFDQSERPLSCPSNSASASIDSKGQGLTSMVQMPKAKHLPQKDLTVIFSSLRENCDDDEDFEDCFEQVEQTKILHPDVKTDDDDDDDDEFGACFEGVNYLERATKDKARASDLELKDVDSSKSSLETLLDAKLKEKNTAFTDRIQNSCRHFKTFESSIQEMERNRNVSESSAGAKSSKTELGKTQSELLDSQDERSKSQNHTTVTKSDVECDDFETVLAIKLAEKKTAFNNNIQNSCRHFKTFETSVQSMKKSSPSVEESKKSVSGNLSSESSNSDMLQDVDSTDVSWYFDSVQGLSETRENIETIQTAFNSCQHLPDSKVFSPSCVGSKPDRRMDCVDVSPDNLKVTCRAEGCSARLTERTGEMGLNVEKVSETGLNVKKVSETGLNVEKVSETGLSVEKVSETGLSVEKVSETGLNVEKVSETGLSIKKTGCCRNVSEILASLCEGLDHGDPVGMGLAVEVYKRQLDQEIYETGSIPRFDLNKVHTYHIPSIGLKDQAILSGFALEVDVLQLTALQKHSHHRIIMINGDLTPSYKHQGYNARHKTVQVAKSDQVCKDNWLTKSVSVLQKLNINAILVKGGANPDLIPVCLSRDIVVLEHVPYKVIHAVSVATKTEPLSYISDATKLNVTSDVKIHPYRDDWMCYPSNRAYVCLDLPLPIQTVMFSHPCQAVGVLREESFWHCANRLANTITSNCVLPGSGETEKLVLKLLENGQNTSYKSAVFRAIAQGFRDYVKKVVSNSHQLSAQSNVTHKDVFREDINPSQDSQEDLQEEVKISRDSVHTSTISSSKGVSNCALPSNNCDTPVKKPKKFDANSCNPSVLGHFEPKQQDSDILGNCARPVFDDYLAKREAWRTAADFVCRVLQTDMYIVTGLGDTESHATQSCLGLL